MKMPASVVLASTPARSVSTAAGAAGWLAAGAAVGTTATAVAAGFAGAEAGGAAGSAGLHAPLRASATVRKSPTTTPRTVTIGRLHSHCSNTLHAGRGGLNGRAGWPATRGHVTYTARVMLRR